MSLPKPYYSDDAVTIYHGDCRDILAELPKVDLVLTDPPYDIHAGHGGGVFGEREYLIKTGGFTDGGVDYSFLAPFSNWFCFCSKSQLAVLIQIAQGRKHWNLLTWCKTNPIPTCNNKYLPDVEYVVHTFTDNRLFGDMNVKSCFFVHSCGNALTEHPNEKPLLLLSKLVTLGSQIGETVLDPFLGSGTTAFAAKKLGRKCIGIEIEEKYCEIAARRCSQTVMDLHA